MSLEKYTEPGFSMSQSLNNVAGFIKKVAKNRIVNNFSALTISNILVQGFSIFSSIKIARNLVPDDFGLFSYILVLSSIYSTFGGLGMRQVIIRSIAVNPLQAGLLFRKSMLYRTLMFLPLLAGILVYNQFFSKITLDYFSLILLALNIMFLSFWDTLESVNFGHQNMKLPSILQLVFTVIWVLVIVLLPARFITVNITLSITVGLQIIKSLIFYFYTYRRNFIHITDKKDKLQVKLVRESSSFFFLSVFTLITTQIPVVYLEQNASDTEIAYYNIALRIIGPVQMLLITFMNVLYPYISRIYANENEKFSMSIKNVFMFLMILGNIGAFSLSLVSNEIIDLLYGSSYAKSSEVFNIQIWYTVLYCSLCYIGMILSAINKQVLLAKLSFVYAVVATPCLFIGSLYGSVGLSVSFLVSAVLNLTYHIYYMQKALDEKIPYNAIFSSFGIFAVLMVVSYFTHEFPLLYRILIGVITVPILIFYLRNQIRTIVQELFLSK